MQNHGAPWTEQDLAILRREYPRKTAGELSETLGRSKDTIWVIANQQGLSKRKGVNAKFFDTWSEEMAWVLGFWVADGCAERDLPNFRYNISFCQKECGILENIRELIGSQHKISSHSSRGMYEIKIYSKRLLAGLQSHFDCDVQRKSLTIQWPNDIPVEYVRHFCRGLIDGDGYLGVTNKRPQLVFVSASPGFMNAFKKAVEQQTGIWGGVYDTSFSAAKAYTINGIKAKCLSHWLYDKCGSLCLDRKRRTYEQIMQWMPIMDIHASDKMHHVFGDILKKVA